MVLHIASNALSNSNNEAVKIFPDDWDEIRPYLRLTNSQKGV